MGNKHFEIKDNFVKNYDYPQISKIEFTSRCQLKCPGCMNSSLSRKSDIQKEVLEEIVRKNYLRNTGFTEVMISGEALLHPEFSDFAEFLSFETGVCLGVSTNLAFPLEILENKMPGLRCMDAITVSVDSFDPATYEAMRVGASFSNLLDNITELDNTLRYDQLIYLQLLLSYKSAPYHDESIEKIHEWVDIHCSDRVVVRYVDDCFLGFMGEPFIPSNDMCLTPFEAVCIKFDGSVVPCGYCFDNQILLGNIMESSLTDIWNSDIVQELREAHRTQTNLPDWCKKCYRRSNHTFQQRILGDIVKWHNGAQPS